MRGHFAEDLTGRKYGSLVVIKRTYEKGFYTDAAGKQKARAMWLCRCECGKEKIVRGAHLRSGRIVSCGCVGRRNCIASHVKHRGSHSRLYGVWANMKNRCYNKNVRSYKNYGGNGIVVCDEWKNNFASFRDWTAGNGYDPEAPYGKCTLDRIDVYGNYCPENCRWVDEKTQQNNRRNSKMNKERRKADGTGETDQEAG